MSKTTPSWLQEIRDYWTRLSAESYESPGGVERGTTTARAGALREQEPSDAPVATVVATRSGAEAVGFTRTRT